MQPQKGGQVTYALSKMTGQLAPGMFWCHGCFVPTVWSRLNFHPHLITHNGMCATWDFHFCAACNLAVDQSGYFHGRHQD